MYLLYSAGLTFSTTIVKSREYSGGSIGQLFKSTTIDYDNSYKWKYNPEAMIIRDRIWGESRVEESILQRLLIHPELCRLKRISQFGLPFTYYPLPQFDRYEHSVGVMMLVRSLGASLEEQVASLLHDASHTSFSHIVDWVIGNPKREDFQDKRHRVYLINSSLASILEEGGFSPQGLADYHSYQRDLEEKSHLLLKSMPMRN